MIGPHLSLEGALEDALATALLEAAANKGEAVDTVDRIESSNDFGFGTCKEPSHAVMRVLYTGFDAISRACVFAALKMVFAGARAGNASLPRIPLAATGV